MSLNCAFCLSFYRCLITLGDHIKTESCDEAKVVKSAQAIFIGPSYFHLPKLFDCDI